MAQSIFSFLPLGNKERSLEQDAFWNGYPFRTFPFGASADVFWGVYDGLFFYPPFYSQTFPYSAKCPGPYPYGYPLNDGKGPAFIIGEPPIPPILINPEL
ncbi:MULTISPECIES: hypothetical protein [Pontibacillus]|uniref:Uncharacterized protein n=1 Tax=Pontibacillus chungwhensis TaxID=265426 RepID=A0ABY8V3I7_9BACI|nr:MULTISPECIES: hypothetical protein [Pontibacillus]MCD5322105.1 hypothetical protein [Pontibacillus sp. HN14]WIF99404.1 hypothetical protein QNI29_07025 [Pontibacillus chungwhensis]